MKWNRSPRIELLFRAGARLHRSRDDLQRAFPDPESPEFWHWLMWFGAVEDQEVRANLAPIPDQFLRDRVVGDGVTDERFHRWGLSDWRRIEQSLRQGGYDFSRPGAVLDFGCGCARILRFFELYARTTEFHGADVDRDAVDWCRRNIEFAQFTQVPFQPPTPYASGKFDGIFSFSVFSHLPEALHLRWLRELHRITTPGAVLVLTTHGEEVIRLLLTGERDVGVPSKERLAKEVDRIRARGFGFFPYERLKLRDARNQNAFEDWDLAAYGIAFVLESYVREHWTEYFDVVDHRPAPDGWQDFVTLRRH